jgi:hypothetical protein
MVRIRVPVNPMAKAYPRVVATSCDYSLPPEGDDLAKQIEDALVDMTVQLVKTMAKQGTHPGKDYDLKNLEVVVTESIKSVLIELGRSRGTSF